MKKQNYGIKDDQHYFVRGIHDFIPNLQQPMVYVVCAKCMWNRVISIWGSVFNNNMSFFY